MLVTPSELATYMDRGSFTNRQEDSASVVLLGLQGELEAFLRRPVESVTISNETHVIPENFGLGGGSIFHAEGGSESGDGTPIATLIGPYQVALHNTPIVSITSVTSYSPTGSSAAASAGVDYVQRAWGIDYYGAIRNYSLKITYQAGPAGWSNYAGAVNFFKLLILRAAAREMQVMTDDVVGLKELTTEHVVPATTGFTEAELFSVRKYRRKQLTG